MNFETDNQTIINIYSVYAKIDDEEEKKSYSKIIKELYKLENLDEFTTKLNNICNKFIDDELNKKEGKNKYTHFKSEIEEKREKIIKKMECSVLNHLYNYKEIDNLDHHKITWKHGILNGVLYCYVKTKFNNMNSLEYITKNGKIEKNPLWSRFD
jgi:hypothetical protein